VLEYVGRLPAAFSLLRRHGLDALVVLAERATRTGLPVRVQVEGDAVPLPRAIELSSPRTGSCRRGSRTRSSTRAPAAPT
jgi:hypothetical protein